MTKNGKSISDTAYAAECSERAVKNIRSNLRLFGTPGTPPNHKGRWSNVTPPMLEALLEYLLDKPGSYLDETADFLRGAFGVEVSTDSISRALKKAKWSKKKSQQKAKEQNPDLRDEYRHNLLEYYSYQLVYVDDLNPIEEFFAELKTFIRRKWNVCKEDPEQDFGVFLERYINTVGSRKRSAEGHFRHAGVVIMSHTF